jgi:hypothetical protein
MMINKRVKGLLKRTGIAASVVVMLWPAISYAESMPAGPQTFSTSQAAAEALIKASEINDTKTLLKLFAPNGKDLLDSGDPAEDVRSRTRFTELARMKMALIPDPADPAKVFISVGDEDWPFPVPLIQKNGLWLFDSSEGQNEVHSRYIGAHELTAIDICRGYVEAQNEYSQTHLYKGMPEYARKLNSSKGLKDGLYWEPAQGELPSPVPADFARAAEDMKRDQRKPYHGYYFRVMTAQGPDAHGGAKNYIVDGAMTGGFALVAWPSEYGETGIQTFVVNQDGIVYQSNLGDGTDAKTPGLTQFNPDSSWGEVQAE